MGFGVRREIVFAAFAAMKIDFAEVPGEKNYFEVAAPNEEQTWTEYLPPELDRRAPQLLSDKYKIPIQWLYNRLMIPGEESKKAPT